MAKETEALLARAAELATLETLEQKLRAVQMQMETQREILNQAERERAALDSLETELGALCASAAIAEHDTERALAEYHRRVGASAACVVRQCAGRRGVGFAFGERNDAARLFRNRAATRERRLRLWRRHKLLWLLAKFSQSIRASISPTPSRFSVSGIHPVYLAAKGFCMSATLHPEFSLEAEQLQKTLDALDGKIKRIEQRGKAGGNAHAARLAFVVGGSNSDASGKSGSGIDAASVERGGGAKILRNKFSAWSVGDVSACAKSGHLREPAASASLRIAALKFLSTRLRILIWRGAR